jgi:hypothetical protein
MMPIIAMAVLGSAYLAVAQVPTTTTTTLSPGNCHTAAGGGTPSQCDDGDRCTDDVCSPFYCHYDPTCDPT